MHLVNLAQSGCDYRFYLSHQHSFVTWCIVYVCYPACTSWCVPVLCSSSLDKRDSLVGRGSKCVCAWTCACMCVHMYLCVLFVISGVLKCSMYNETLSQFQSICFHQFFFLSFGWCDRLLPGVWGVWLAFIKSKQASPTQSGMLCFVLSVDTQTFHLCFTL